MKNQTETLLESNDLELERELNVLFEMTMKMEHELRVVVSERE